jgi:hypothetical protein
MPELIMNPGEPLEKRKENINEKDDAFRPWCLQVAALRVPAGYWCLMGWWGDVESHNIYCSGSDEEMKKRCRKFIC